MEPWNPTPRGGFWGDPAARRMPLDWVPSRTPSGRVPYPWTQGRSADPARVAVGHPYAGLRTGAAQQRRRLPLVGGAVAPDVQGSGGIDLSPAASP